jgi:acetyltransferase-like isoleucine patch superfamily enzyme
MRIAGMIEDRSGEEGSFICSQTLISHNLATAPGVTIMNGMPGKPIAIGKKSVIGAGAVVIRDVAAGCTVVGVPARPLEGPEC